MLEKLKKNKENIFVYLVFAIYAIVSLVLVIKHESWADEAQAWLIARDLNIFGIIKQMKYEGHSCMWHLILMPFAKLGFPYATIKIISWIFCLIAVYLILKKAPLNKFIKILLIFNPGMIYLYPVIARVYSLIPVILVGILIVEQNKEEHPYLYAVLLALLANTHLSMLTLVGILTIYFWGDKLILKRKELNKNTKKILLKSFIVVLIGIFIYLAQVATSLIDCKIVESIHPQNNMTVNTQLKNSIKLAAKNTQVYFFGHTPKIQYVLYVSIALIIIASAFDKKNGIIFWMQILSYFILNGVIWFLIKQRAYLIILFLMCFVWNYNPKYKKDNFIVKNLLNFAFILLIISTLPTYRMIIDDYQKNYSSAKDMADYINKNIPKESAFICPNNETVCPIIPYLGKDDYKFYAPNGYRYFTYAVWDEDWKIIVGEKRIEKAVENLKNDNITNIYILRNKYSYSELQDQVIEYLNATYPVEFVSDDSIHKYYSEFEDYVLYKVD